MDRHAAFSLFLADGDLLVTLMTSAEGVDIPPHLRGQETVNFIVGPTPTPKLATDDWGITAPMRFGGVLHVCRWPWNAIIQLSSQEAVLSFRSEGESLPARKESAVGETAPGSPPDPKGRPNLRIVK